MKSFTKKQKLDLAICHILQRTFLEKVHKKDCPVSFATEKEVIEIMSEFDLIGEVKIAPFTFFYSDEERTVNNCLDLNTRTYTGNCLQIPIIKTIEFTEEELLTYYKQKEGDFSDI